MTTISLRTEKIKNASVWGENFLIYYLVHTYRYTYELIKKNFPHTHYFFLFGLLVS
jgi:hypothetical protein